MKKYVLFDLDGTIIDSAEGVINGLMFAMDHYGVKGYDRQLCMQFIGPPLRDTFELLVGEAEADAATAKYREYYMEKGQFECRAYDGVKDMLQRLYDEGRTLILATSKFQALAESILERLGLRELFAYISGNDPLRADKTAVMRHALEIAGVEDKSLAVMVGDRKYDVDGSKAVGIECIGVLYGFGQRDELMRHGVDYLAETTEKVADLVLKL